jgi:hypothetical protein
MAAELVPADPERSGSIGLTSTQVNALEQLHRLGAQPRANPDDKYDSNPQIRALQMVFEGRFGGGPRTTRSRQQRISVGLTEYVRGHLGKKVQKALDRALKADAGERINLDAIKLIVEMEHKEAKLQLSEDQADIDNQTKEELLATLFELVQDAQTASVINATFSDITPQPSEENLLALSQEVKRREQSDAARARAARSRARARASAAESGERNGDSSDASANGSDTGRTRQHGRRVPASDRPARPDPIPEAALRRAADRRRASRVGKAEPPR